MTQLRWSEEQLNEYYCRRGIKPVIDSDADVKPRADKKTDKQERKVRICDGRWRSISPRAHHDQNNGYVDELQRRKRLAQTEEELHMACFEWIKAIEGMYPVLEWVFHPPNGGSRSKAEAGRFKAMGVKKGVSDFVQPFPSAHFPGFLIELKSSTGKLSDDQKKWLNKAKSEGWLVGVARTLDEFQGMVMLYLKGKRG